MTTYEISIMIPNLWRITAPSREAALACATDEALKISPVCNPPGYGPAFIDSRRTPGVPESALRWLRPRPFVLSVLEIPGPAPEGVPPAAA